MNLTVKKFDELTIDELYEILKARAEVFVVEQNCIYQDLDDKDRHSYHVFLNDDTGVAAYLRVVEKGISYEEVSIGRVLTVKRGCGLGERIMSEGIRVAKEKMNADKVKISAQTYAKGFYEKAGFRQASEEYLEDDIPHIKMVLNLGM